MKNVIEKFYIAFQNKDAETMVACYHENVIFEDPAFGVLKGKRAGNMWRMLCENGKDLKLNFSKVTVTEDKGKASWEADYTFSQTGRKIHNNIEASFEFKDGKIIKHTDNFNLHQWAKQALGFKGFLLGGTSFFRNKLNTQTNRLLKKYEEKNRL